ncbi:MAG: cupin domain-containing protein [Candidatus Tectomicrobia bacterium]|nr:cupin domain-containing protein [Candidatus Tectomicrobia bacterium]
MPNPIRRVVTGHDANGKAVVLMDGAASNVVARGGSCSTLLWVTDGTPVQFSNDKDEALRTIGIPPPANGSNFRIVEFLPQQGELDWSSQEAFKAMGVAPVLPPGQKPRHPGMHRTDTLDYALVLSGEIDMLMDDSEIHVKQGDVVIQQGTNHAWANRGKAPCVIAFVLIDAVR